MGLSSYLTGVALLASTALAQVASYSTSNYGVEVNIPSDTASSKSGSIYFQITAPSGTQWVGFGQGNRMSNANMFVVYASGKNNVTLSPRSPANNVMPKYNSAAQVTLLEGSGINSDGSLTANVRCDSCLSWSGGTMDPTSSSTNWIWAYKTGSALNSADASASINQHSNYGNFNLDLTKATGGSSTNPFIAAAASSGSPSSSAAASGTGTSTAAGSSSTSGSTSGNSNSGTTTSSTTSSSKGKPASNSHAIRSAHGILMTILFLVLFPLVSLTLYLPTTKKVRYIHAPLQILNIILLIIGLALGIVIGKRYHQLDAYHQIIGYIVFVAFILFQPAMGLYQHLYFHKTGGRSIFGVMHRWLGRTMILLGVINGGLGWFIASSTGAYIPYGVVAGVVFLVYLTVLFVASRRTPEGKDAVLSDEGEKEDRAAEMRGPSGQGGRGGHARLPSEEVGRNLNNTAYMEQRSGGRTVYTVGNHRV